VGSASAALIDKYVTDLQDLGLLRNTQTAA
jgi:hypothetical protein